MRILLLYFTGTYNTRFLTQKVKKRLEKDGHSVSCLEVNKDANLPSLENIDLLGFGYPIYGFNVPHPFMKFVHRLSIPKGLRYFVYKDSGETYGMNQVSSRRIHRFMRKRGSISLGEYHYVMPYNIHFEFSIPFIKEAIREDKKLLEVMVRNIENGSAKKEKFHPLYNVGAFFVGVQALGGPINSFFYKVDLDKCTRCGLCAKRCPEGNIQIQDGRVRFGRRCDMCMRCSFDCPAKAIHIGFLERWLVHRYYSLSSLWDCCDGEPFVQPDTKGFYRCFYPYFQTIDRWYSELEN